MTVDANLIESCLSHTPRRTSRANYNKAKLVMPMRKAFQEYSDHLDRCKTEDDNQKWISDNNIILLNTKKLIRLNLHHLQIQHFDSLSKLQDVTMWSNFIDKCDTKENNERVLKNEETSLI